MTRIFKGTSEHHHVYNVVGLIGYIPEKLYQSEHPRLVSLFDNAAAVDEDEDGYLISKAWLKGSVVAVVFRISSPLIVPW